MEFLDSHGSGSYPDTEYEGNTRTGISTAARKECNGVMARIRAGGFRMDREEPIKAIRRQRLRELIDTLFSDPTNPTGRGVAARFARAVERKATHINDMLSDPPATADG